MKKHKPIDIKSYIGVGVCVVTIFSLVCSFFSKNEYFAIYGSGFYLIALIIEDIASYVYMKKNKNIIIKKFREQAFKKYDPEKNCNAEVQNSNESVIKTVRELLQGSIIIFGLIVFITKSEIFMTAGSILWVGTIVNYMASGILVSVTLGIPLRIGYDLGWHFDYRKK